MVYKGSKQFFLLFFFSVLPIFMYPQEEDTTKVSIDVGVRIGITNNAFSFVPAFTLDKPAASLEIFLKWKRFSIEPQFQYSLEGKPWSLIFIYRYKIITDKKYQFTAGTHLPVLPVGNADITSGGVTSNRIVADRFVVGELSNTYTISPKV